MAAGYTIQEWEDEPEGGTPISSARLDYMEAGIAAAASPTIDANVYVADHTLTLDDLGEVAEFDSAGPVVCTIPPNADVDMPLGAIVEIAQIGVGQVTIAFGAGVDYISPEGLKIAAQGGTVTARQRAIDEWILSGYLEP